ncbi:MAG: type II secretion system ATPase GspE [Pseudomonadota bacterium]
MSETTDPVIQYAFAKERGVVLLEGGARPRIALREGASPAALIEARRAFGAPISVERLAPTAFDRRLSEVYAVEGIGSAELAGDLNEAESLSALAEDIPQTADLLEANDDAPIIRLINGLISEAVKMKASDIHIEPYENRLSVRLRVDGVLREILNLSQRVAPPLVSRIKVMARLDIAEKRVPQDGRISLSLAGKAIDVRVSTLPSRHGERAVLRLLDKDEARFDLDHLGMSEDILKRYQRALGQPNGVVLVTGPTGSGKTTTLYGGLNALNDQTRNILTVEDPIEYAIDGVGQTQVNAKVGMSFAAGLRAILRQDPDVVMVGEIRDVETAEIAVQASLTGHLVLSTVHTNSAAAAVTRLRDMGVEPFLISSTVSLIIAQRLVRRLCDACKTPRSATAREKEILGAPAGEELTLYQPKGCAVCGHIGYNGRLGIYEAIVVDETLRQMIHDDARETDIAAYAFRESSTLLQSGLSHIRAGLTSAEEVLRVCRHEGESDGDV